MSALGAGAVAAGQVFFSLHAPYPPPPRFSADPWLVVSLPLFFGGGLLALIGLSRLALPTLEPGEAPPDAGRTSTTHKIAFVLLLLIGFAARAYRITEMPPPLFDDEANVAIDAMKYREGQFPPGTLTGWFETPLAFTAVNSLALGTFGPTVLGSRVTGVVFGTLTVPAVYFAARAMMGPTIGLLAMAMLALERWHVTISRFGANHITLPFLVVVAFACTCWAFDLVMAARPAMALTLRRPRSTTRGRARPPIPGETATEPSWMPTRARFAIAGGACLGAAMYTYLPSRFAALGMFFFLAYFAALSLVLQRRPGATSGALLRKRLMLCVVYGVSYLLVFAPLALHYLAHPGMFTNRYKSINLFQQMGVGTEHLDWQPPITNLTAYPMMLNYAGNEVSRYGPPFHPVLNAVVATLLALGVILLLRTWRHPASVFSLVWLGAPLLGGVITWSETPSPFRTIITSTAVPVIAVIPCYYASLWLRRRGAWEQPGVRRVFCATVAGLLIASGILDVRTYWGAQRFDPQLHRYCNYPEYAVAQRVREIDDRDPIYLRPHLYTFSSIKLLNWNRPNLRLFAPSEHIPMLEPNDADVHIFLDLEANELTRSIASFHPQATVLVRALEETPGFGYTEVIIPAAALAQSRGFWMTAGIRPRTRVPSLEAPPGKPGESVFWEAILDAPQLGAYRFRIRPETDAARLALVIAGRVVTSPDDPVSLLAGRAELRLEGRGLPPGEHFTLEWRPPNGEWEAVPKHRVYAFDGGLSHGLRGSYYLGMTPDGPPFAERVDLLAAADESIPSPHSVRWKGLLDIPADGVYSFHARADDGVRLWLDGKAWIDRWTVGGTAGDARGFLARGRHQIQIDYFDQGGGRILELRWTPPGGVMSEIPFDLLSHESTGPEALGRGEVGGEVSRRLIRGPAALQGESARTPRGVLRSSRGSLEPRHPGTSS